MKNLFFIFLFLPTIMFAGRNPIMVINCAAADAAKSSSLKANSSCSTDGDCPSGFGCYVDGYCYPVCPQSEGEDDPLPGTICVDGLMIPDCSGAAGGDCLACDGEAIWDPSSARCICESIFLSQANTNNVIITPSECECPPNILPPPIPAATNNGASGGCVAAYTCYDGDISFTVSPTDCANAGSTVTTTITIMVPNGVGLQISDLENCALTNNANFFLELKEVYGTSAAFVDDDNDGIIEIEFVRDPTQPTVIDWVKDGLTDIIIPACPSITDPCSCTDPLNVVQPDGTVTLFHDLLTIISAPGQMINLVTNNNATGFADNTGVGIPNGTLLGTTDQGGTLLYDFYRAPGAAGTVNILLNNGAQFNSVCGLEADGCIAAPIPTLSRWALGILAFGFIFIAIRMFRTM